MGCGVKTTHNLGQAEDSCSMKDRGWDIKYPGCQSSSQSIDLLYATTVVTSAK